MSIARYTPKSEIESRIARFQAEISKFDCDGAMITHHTNLFYFSGTSQNGHLFIPRSGDPILMIRKSYTRAREESPIEHIIDLKSLKRIPERLKDAGYSSSKVLGFELDVIPYNTYALYGKIFSESKIIDISGAIKAVRLIKSPYEIELLHEACAVIDEVYSEVPDMLREGMTEIELASLFEAGMRRRGYGGCCKMRAFNQDFFFGNVTSGSSGAVPTYFDGPIGGTGLTPANNPHGAGWKKIKRDEIIYIDYTCVVNGYTADEARMFAIGKISDTLTDAYNAALTIQKEMLDLAKPSRECQAIYKKALELAAEFGYAENFMGLGDERVKFVGHGVGLELDEAPIFAEGIRMQLAPGMTFALEPKFVFPEGAIGIENTFAMGEQGAVFLTHSTEEIISV
ncbi:MAG: Xaa-Pro peptidase family protein [Candidatus Syntrophoarchaeum sp.]|nr:Xaa-Pro peptidase family protein [Candidatus Syntrophoarchaeum sp.]